MLVGPQVGHSGGVDEMRRLGEDAADDAILGRANVPKPVAHLFVLRACRPVTRRSVLCLKVGPGNGLRPGKLRAVGVSQVAQPDVRLPPAHAAEPFADLVQVGPEPVQASLRSRASDLDVVVERQQDQRIDSKVGADAHQAVRVDAVHADKAHSHFAKTRRGGLRLWRTEGHAEVPQRDSVAHRRGHGLVADGRQERAGPLVAERVADEEDPPHSTRLQNRADVFSRLHRLQSALGRRRRPDPAEAGSARERRRSFARAEVRLGRVPGAVLDRVVAPRRVALLA
mmetsp:Transcript_4188/g.14706  ORF Transcript_4188/g.14706 Transcript_4188/m.14706 type:complete len:284 (-) Transcript_4188:428-1279(-)